MSHTSPPSTRRQYGRTGGQTTPTDPCSQHNQASRSGGHREAELKAHHAKTACPACVLPEGPCPSRPNLRSGPANNPHPSSFMPRAAIAGTSGFAQRRLGAARRRTAPRPGVTLGERLLHAAPRVVRDQRWPCAAGEFRADDDPRAALPALADGKVPSSQWPHGVEAAIVST